MPKRHQQHPAKSVSGANNPKKTTENRHTHTELDLTHKQDSQARMQDREKRSGSDSDATSGRKGERLHEHHKNIREPEGHQPQVDFSRDLNVNQFAGENHGMQGENTLDYEHSANDIKELHTILADLGDEELKNIVLVKDGSRLEQGAKYIDLKHLEDGEFVATASMVAQEGHYYVAKKAVDYVLWNRLNQVDNPTRLDESGNA